jgi:hypothetical protein
MLASLRPVFAAQSRWVARGLVALGVVGFIVGGAVALSTPAFTATYPQRLNVRFYQDGSKASVIADSSWAGSTLGPAPAPVKAAMGPSATEGTALPWQSRPALHAAGQLDPTLTPPSFRILEKAAGSLRLHVAPSRGGRMLFLFEHREGAPPTAVLDGKRATFASGFGPEKGNLLTLYGVPPEGIDLELAILDPTLLEVAEPTPGLPPQAMPVAAARDASTAVPYQGGDDTIVGVRIR